MTPQYNPISGTVPNLNATSGIKCFNVAQLAEYIKDVVDEYNNTSGNSLKWNRREVEGDPMVYIVTVLIFYSCGIVILMVNYMRKEQNETEEENLYKLYVEKARDRCNEINNPNRGSSLNRLALHALNAINIIPQSNQEPDKRITFV